MSDPLFRKELLRYAADANGAGRLAAPDTTGLAYNPACGDKVTVDLALAGSQIAAMAHVTKACILAQAAASMLAESLKGTDRAMVERARGAIAAMLESNGAAPAPPFAAFAAFRGALEFRNRHRCVLLPLEAVLAAFDASDAAKPV